MLFIVLINYLTLLNEVKHQKTKTKQAI